jgi:toxin ParE1/3/4
VKVRFLKRAVQDLINIDNFTRKESPRGAARIGARIRKRADDLAQFPEQGTASDKVGVRQLYVAKTPYILVYRIKNDEVQIITILHASNRRS